MTDRSLRPSGQYADRLVEVEQAGVELTLSSLVQGLAQQGHQLTLIAPGILFPEGAPRSRSS